MIADATMKRAEERERAREAAAAAQDAESARVAKQIDFGTGDEIEEQPGKSIDPPKPKLVPAEDTLSSADRRRLAYAIDDAVQEISDLADRLKDDIPRAHWPEMIARFHTALDARLNEWTANRAAAPPTPPTPTPVTTPADNDPDPMPPFLVRAENAHLFAAPKTSATE
jgi:hypothetical protein